MTTSTPLFCRAALLRHHTTDGTLQIGGDRLIGLLRSNRRFRVRRQVPFSRPCPTRSNGSIDDYRPWETTPSTPCVPRTVPLTNTPIISTWKAVVTAVVLQSIGFSPHRPGWIHQWSRALAMNFRLHC